MNKLSYWKLPKQCLVDVRASYSHHILVDFHDSGFSRQVVKGNTFYFVKLIIIEEMQQLL